MIASRTSFGLVRDGRRMRVANYSRSYDEPKPALSAAGGVVDRRAEVERQQQERAAERQQQIAAQSSELHAPEERIRLWEKLHALPLPRSATHKLLHVIAQQTRLSIQQVREEQQRRASLSGQSLIDAAT
jgi:hypothetical protein